VASADNKTAVKLARAKWHTHQRKMNVKQAQKQPLQYTTPPLFRGFVRTKRRKYGGVVQGKRIKITSQTTL